MKNSAVQSDIPAEYHAHETFGYKRVRSGEAWTAAPETEGAPTVSRFVGLTRWVTINASGSKMSPGGGSIGITSIVFESNEVRRAAGKTEQASSVPFRSFR